MALAPIPSDNRLTFAKLASILLNSAALYVAAYMLMQFVVQATQATLAYRYSIPTIWYPSRLNFRIQDPEWRRAAIVVVFSAGQIVALIPTIFFLFRLPAAQEERGLLKVFYMWMVLHGLNQFFGAMVVDNFLSTGFWLAPRYLFLSSEVPAVTLGFLFANLCLLFGYKLALPFLHTCDSISLMRLDNRTALVWTTIFGPWFVGTLLINLCKLGTISGLELAHLVSILILLIPMAVGVRFEMHEQTVQNPLRPRLNKTLLLLTLLSLGLFRFVFEKGIFFKPHGYLNYPGYDTVIQPK